MKILLIKWMDIGYAAMMLGEKKDKPNDWEGRFTYLFNTHLFFFTTAFTINIFNFLFPFNNDVYKLIMFVLVSFNGIYIFYYDNTFKKLLKKINYDPSHFYKKNTFRDLLSVIFILSSVVLFFLFFVFSFYLFNYLKFLIGI